MSCSPSNQRTWVGYSKLGTLQMYSQPDLQCAIHPEIPLDVLENFEAHDRIAWPLAALGMSRITDEEAVVTASSYARCRPT